MSKVFLSHSSADKQYVSQIADKFGKDIAVFDEYSFEQGMKTIEEIFKGIQSSDVFVIFISDASLNSSWVADELSLAHKKLDANQLMRIFPIIIDPRIDHSDTRIPEWMRQGRDSYNLQYIRSPKIAYKKIMSKICNFRSDYRLYVGHEDLQKRFDEDFYLAQTPKKCIVACGIEGIGRESFIRACIKAPKTFPNNYEPSVIDLQKNDSIDDVIIKLMDIGFGEPVSVLTAEKINGMTLPQKIDTLSELMREIQNSLEFVIIRDQSAIIKNGDIEWWFLKALENIRPELTIGIVSDSLIRFNKNNKDCYIESINELDKSGKLKLLDNLSAEYGLNLDREDVLFFLDILTGHPKQVIFCLQKIKNESLDEVKKKSYEICEFVSQSTIRLIEKYITLLNYDEDQRVKFVSYLAFLSNYSNVPVTEVLKINELDPDYEKYYHQLISFCICRRTGMNNDLLSISPSVVDYIDRNRVKMPKDIELYLKKEYEQFKNCLKSEGADEYCYSQIERNLLELVKENTDSSNYKYIFPSIILKAVVQLYNRQSYEKIISICNNIMDSLELWDKYIRQTLIFYYSMALAHRKDHSLFDVISMQTNGEYVLEKFQYEFVKGFYYKLIGNYEIAADCFKQCLENNNRYVRASRELVETYIDLEKYDLAKDLAKQNYDRFSDNIFNIFQYFKCVVFSKNPDIDLLKEMLQKAKDVDNLSKSGRMFYPNMRALFELKINHSYEKALQIMEENRHCFDNKIYYYKDLFDIYVEKKDVPKMEETYMSLTEAINGDKCFYPLQIRRECVLSYYKNHDLERVDNIIRISDLSKAVKKDISEYIHFFVTR